MTGSTLHPALAADTDCLVCADQRCATVLPADAELCDECGGSSLVRLNALPSVLCAWAETRPVAFQVWPGRRTVIGRSAGGSVADVDLSRVPGSEAVHRQHALIEEQADEWRVTQLGANPVVVNGREAVPTGETRPIRPGDTLALAGVLLQLVVRPGRSTG